MFYNPVLTLQVIGRIAADPVIRNTGAGDKVANIRVLVNERWNDANGERQERVHSIDCAAYRGLADVIEKYAHTGQLVLVEGKPTAEAYLNGEDQEPRASLKIPSMNSFRMLANSPNQTGGSHPNPGDAEVVEEDIPF